MEHVGLHTTQVSENMSEDQQKPKVAETEELPVTQPFEFVCVKEEQSEEDYEVKPVASEVCSVVFHDSEEHSQQHIKGEEEGEGEEVHHSEDRDSVHERPPNPAADDNSVPVEEAALHAETPAYLTDDSNYTTLPEESECDGNKLWNSNYSEHDSTLSRLRLTLKKKRRSRTGEKSYPCNECGKSFPKPCQLKYHMRKHTGERPYICGICGKTFAKTAHLNVHNRTHTGEKPFKCDVCGKSFPDSGKQKRHMRSHAGEKPYVCDICGKCYTVHGSLTSHKRSHTGENAYKCDVCNKTFPRPSVLKVHMRSHTGEKPHECGVCGKGFTQFGNLKRHLHSHIMGSRLSSVMVSTAE
ncbi:zinc finger protein 135 isoform X1 [Schistocerca serialis cubense]|uniref:zinc finger protein 135 isoform X1 n=2 Tax=Schistocerca serialis cubense TaxID=2023355 RepID=UPI00214E9CAB|nr:zinc finger protein 135 isoform X1 [Schistocerca serialis cubense]